jgi:hypothetical protein
MQATTSPHRTDLRALLAEFSAHDAGLLVNEYLRKVLLIVSATTEARNKDLPVERQLVLRLLLRHTPIAHRFATLFLNELQGPLSSPVRSNNVHRLSKRIHANTREEAAALERILQQHQRDFDLTASAFDPVRYAHCLEGALHDAIELAPQEKDIVFRAWSGLFAETVRESYIRYIQVLLGGSELAPQVQQDFKDTIPFALESRPGSPPAPQPGRRPASLAAG